MFYQAFSRLVNHTDLTFEALQIQDLQTNTEQVGSRACILAWADICYNAVVET